MRRLILVGTALAVAGTPLAVAAPKPAAPVIRREVITVDRTKPTGTAVLALTMTVTAKDVAGYAAAFDLTYHKKGAVRYADLVTNVDFGLAGPIAR